MEIEIYLFQSDITNLILGVICGIVIIKLIKVIIDAIPVV
jgi:hypothetical protein